MRRYTEWNSTFAEERVSRFQLEQDHVKYYGMQRVGIILVCCWLELSLGPCTQAGGNTTTEQ